MGSSFHYELLSFAQRASKTNALDRGATLARIDDPGLGQSSNLFAVYWTVAGVSLGPKVEGATDNCGVTDDNLGKL